MATRRLRLAALGDLHCSKTPQAVIHALLDQAAADADVLLLCGDLTDHGTEDEARILAKALASVRTPVVAVLGNHDYESGVPDRVKDILAEAGVNVLDGEAVEIQGVGFAGVKGFAGGFGPRSLQPWGEELIKQFVHEAVNEALKLETALAKLSSPDRVALLHYAPVQTTVEGEAREIFAFLGSSRLEEPLSRYGVSAVFHGHAHHGTAEGRTRDDVPVYNVAVPLLQRVYPDRAPFRIVELPVS